MASNRTVRSCFRRSKRAELAAKEEAERRKNVARKLAIIEQVKALTESQAEDFNKPTRSSGFAAGVERD